MRVQPGEGFPLFHHDLIQLLAETVQVRERGFDLREAFIDWLVHVRTLASERKMTRAFARASRSRGKVRTLNCTDVRGLQECVRMNN